MFSIKTTNQSSGCVAFATQCNLRCLYCFLSYSILFLIWELYQCLDYFYRRHLKLNLQNHKCSWFCQALLLYHCFIHSNWHILFQYLTTRSLLFMDLFVRLGFRKSESFLSLCARCPFINYVFIYCFGDAGSFPVTMCPVFGIYCFIYEHKISLIFLTTF